MERNSNPACNVDDQTDLRGMGCQSNHTCDANGKPGGVGGNPIIIIVRMVKPMPSREGTYHHRHPTRRNLQR